MSWLHIHYNSDTLHMPVPMDVLLPQYNFKTVHSSTYPVLYLLHGMGDDNTSWIRKTSIERYSDELSLAVVMPAGHKGWYTDMAYGSNYFKFIAQELPAICERMFSISSKREDRFIAGCAMGGYGAIKAGLLASNTFSKAASFSGTFDRMNIFNSLGESCFNDIFTSKENFECSNNNLFLAATNLCESDAPRPEIYIACEKQNLSYNSNIRFKEHLLSLRIPVTYKEDYRNGGWEYWDACIKDMLKWLSLDSSHKEVF